MKVGDTKKLIGGRTAIISEKLDKELWRIQLIREFRNCKFIYERTTTTQKLRGLGFV